MRLRFVLLAALITGVVGLAAYRERSRAAYLVIADDELDIFPTRRFWTARHLFLVHDALSDYRRTHNRFPDRLEDLCVPDGRPCGYERPEKWIRDAWCTPLRYEASHDTFDLRSAGADKIFGTADDLLLNKPSDDEIKRRYFAGDSVERYRGDAAVDCTRRGRRDSTAT